MGHRTRSILPWWGTGLVVAGTGFVLARASAGSPRAHTVLAPGTSLDLGGHPATVDAAAQAYRPRIAPLAETLGRAILGRVGACLMMASPLVALAVLGATARLGS